MIKFYKTSIVDGDIFSSSVTSRALNHVSQTSKPPKPCNQPHAIILAFINTYSRINDHRGTLTSFRASC